MNTDRLQTLFIIAVVLVALMVIKTTVLPKIQFAFEIKREIQVEQTLARGSR